MKTITLWLLISIGEAGGNGLSTTAVVERFAAADECSRVLKAIHDAVTLRTPRLLCIEAAVVRP